MGLRRRLDVNDRVRDLRERLHQPILDDVRQAVGFVERRVRREPDVQIQEAMMDPRQMKVAERNTGSAKLEPERPAAPDRARQLMHGIFMGELQALEGAGRTTFDFDDEDVPFQLKLDMARQSWDESRHCEISVKLAEHMGTEIGEFSEATFLYEAACAEDATRRTALD